MLPILTALAPNLLGALTGPLGAVASGVISKIFGKDIATPDDVEAAAMGLSPSQLVELKVQLKRADVDFAAQYVRAAEIDAGDRQDARRTNTINKDVTPKILSYLAVIGFFCTIYITFKNPDLLKDPQACLIIGTILGYTFSCVKDVFSYYFGSSSSSRFKDQAIIDKKGENG